MFSVHPSSFTICPSSSCTKLLCSPADPFCVGRFFPWIALSLYSFLPWTSWSLAWENAEDNKPAAELQAMDEPTLAWEVQGPCVKAATTALIVTTDTLAKRKEALQYLALIITVMRKKDNKVPPWLYELASQAESGSLQKCNEIAKRVYLPPEPPPPEKGKQAGASEKPKKKKK
jgi:hypothetical protein